MFDAVIAYCTSNSSIIATVPAFQSAFASFQSTVSEIHSVVQLQVNVITGITADKAKMKDNLAGAAANLAATVFAYASNSGNNALKEQVNFPPSELKSLKDKMLVATSGNIRDAANANLAALNNYGITAESITGFQTIIDAYVAQMSSPRNAVSQRASHAKTLVNLFKQANDALKTQLDKIALQFKLSNADFYNTYKSNRIVIDPGTSTTQIIGTITNAANDQPVEGATVQLVGSELSTVTDEEGIYNLKPVGIGNQSIKITKTGFADNTISNRVVKLGKTATADAAINAMSV